MRTIVTMMIHKPDQLHIFGKSYVVLWFSCLFLLAALPVEATHFAGSTLCYEFITFDTDSNKYAYKVTGKLYRDPTGTAWPVSLDIDIHENDGPFTYYGSRTLPQTLTDSIFPVPYACIYDPSQVSSLYYVVSTYEDTIWLDANLQGYHLVHTGCCRNGGVVNLIDPTSTGYLLTAFVSPTPMENSSPCFADPVIPFICRNETIHFSNLVSEADGDSLVYRFIAPYDENAGTGPPFDTVAYNTGFHKLQPFGPGSSASLDPQTGVASFRAPNTGLYLVGIEIAEFRNSTEISAIRKEIMVMVYDCAPMVNDCVWPGDANTDGIVNVYDLLPMAVGFSTTGPVRTDANLNWYGQNAPDWSNNFSYGLNYKHADYNGDGIINHQDTTAIVQNYNLTRSKSLQKNDRSSLPPLYLQFQEDSVAAGDTAHVDIFLGTDSNRADSVYALAFRLNYDPMMVDSGSFTFDFSGSWIGDFGNDFITLIHDDHTSGTLEMAMARIDHVELDSFGSVAAFNIIMIDDLSGKDLIARTFAMEITDPLLISSQYDTISVSAFGDSVVVYDRSSGLPGPKQARLRVYPNPATQQIFVECETLSDLRISGLLGEIMYDRPIYGQSRVTIDTHQWPNGVYFIQAETPTSRISGKFIIIQ